MPTDMYWNSEKKLAVRVPVSYQVCGTVYCEFDSVADMFEKLNDSDYIDEMGLADDSEYVGDSYEINTQILVDYMIPAFEKEENDKPPK